MGLRQLVRISGWQMQLRTRIKAMCFLEDQTNLVNFGSRTSGTCQQLLLARANQLAACVHPSGTQPLQPTAGKTNSASKF